MLAILPLSVFAVLPWPIDGLLANQWAISGKQMLS